MRWCLGYALSWDLASVRISCALSLWGAAPRAMSGLPPPLPPAMAVRFWMILPAMCPAACPSVPLSAPRWSLSPSSTMNSAAFVNCFFLQPLSSSWSRLAGPWN